MPFKEFSRTIDAPEKQAEFSLSQLKRHLKIATHLTDLPYDDAPSLEGHSRLLEPLRDYVIAKIISQYSYRSDFKEKTSFKIGDLQFTPYTTLRKYYIWRDFGIAGQRKLRPLDMDWTCDIKEANAQVVFQGALSKEDIDEAFQDPQTGKRMYARASGYLLARRRGDEYIITDYNSISSAIRHLRSRMG